MAVITDIKQSNGHSLNSYIFATEQFKYRIFRKESSTRKANDSRHSSYIHPHKTYVNFELLP